MLTIKTTGIEQYLGEAGDAHIKMLVLGPPSSGKGHPISTKVLTPEGWTEVGKLQVGDFVIGSDGQPTEVYGVYDRGVLPVYRVHMSDGVSVLVDGDHLWRVVNAKKRSMVLSTLELRDQKPAKGKGFYAPLLSGPVQHPHRELPLPPYVLGALIADGHLCSNNRSVQWTKNDPAIVEEMERQLNEVGLVLRHRTKPEPGAGAWQHIVADPTGQRPNGMGIVNAALSHLGLRVRSADKFIPEVYLHSSPEQRLLLLQGLFDGDGRLTTRHRPVYHTTSPRLANDVAELIRSLGFMASVGSRKTDGTFAITLRTPRDRAGFSPFRAKVVQIQPVQSQRFERRIVSITEEGQEDVRCIAVAASDQLYVTEGHIVTHNTRLSSFAPKPIFADCEGGLMSVADQKVPYAEIRSSGDMDALLRTLEAESKKAPASRRWNTLVIDTLDAYQRIIIDEIIRPQGKSSMSGWQDWGQLDAAMNRLLIRIHKLKMNVIICCHVKTKDTDNDGPARTEPKLKGDLRDQIAAEFDFVALMRTRWSAEDGKRTLVYEMVWQPTPELEVLKDRSNQMPPVMPVEYDGTDAWLIIQASINSNYVHSIAPGEVVDEVSVHEGPTPVEGGPAVAPGAAKAVAKKTAKRATAAKKSTAKAETPVQEDLPEQPGAKRAVKKAAPASEAPQKPESEGGAASGSSTPEKAAEPEGAGAEGEESAPSDDGAVRTVEQSLGGTVVSSEAAVGPDRQVCGSVWTKAKIVPVQGIGCGEALSKERSQMAVLSRLRTGRTLCPDCFQQWKNATT